uniref:Uncharacterized protein n=1 Tax=Siphoviridae sp. ctYh54 TaxID=2826379 RepID=A0A8S5MEJ5_9CAUD|nr:MAG TPA: hypothetical protein [Siphoviridae sp. ctYh54]
MAKVKPLFMPRIYFSEEMSNNRMKQNFMK